MCSCIQQTRNTAGEFTVTHAQCKHMRGVPGINICSVWFMCLQLLGLAKLNLLAHETPQEVEMLTC